jgi:prevent-host-death family protein
VSWPAYDAKARFSEFLETTVKEGPQVLTRRGIETAVLVPIDEWKRLKGPSRPNIKEILLDPMARTIFISLHAAGFAFPRRPFPSRMIGSSPCICSIPM